MRLVIQRVKEAKVEVDGRVVGAIEHGLLILLGVAKDDHQHDIEFLLNKLISLRIFEDAQGKMNLSIEEVKGEFLIVSQFTLLGDCRKGRRPSFDQAADPKTGEEMYLQFVHQLRARNFKVETGQFRAMMQVALINDGPVTFVLDSKQERC